jgi:DNA repair exonuclease SbcCD ATPase subunit
VRILQSAGLVHDPERSWADHVRELAERVRGGSRLDVLERELIPRAMKRVLDAPAVADLRSRLAAVRGEHGGGLPPARRTAETIDDDARREHELLDALQQRRSALRAEVDAACHRHAEEAPAKRTECAALEAALRRARDFKAAVELAASEIQAVAEATHRRWADFLNRRVAELLATFGTRVEQLRFGDDLDFSLRAWNGQPMTRGRAVLQLSAGARDQLHLAVRLAIAEYLSRPGVGLPLLLDDPFATSDDARARAGMRLLIEHVATRHPIVLVTCHRARHERLQSLDPELWRDGVHWVDVAVAERSPQA